MTASDNELWRRAAGGDVEAFGALFSRHAPAVYAFCLRRTADQAAAPEAGAPPAVTRLREWRVVAQAGESRRALVDGSTRTVTLDAR